MKKLLLYTLAVLFMASCASYPRNHSGIQHWKSGKKGKMVRSSERPQCVDSW